MSSVLTIPVRIIAIEADSLVLEILEAADVCPQCARGEGCGARPWFRGFFREKRMVLPRDAQDAWQCGDLATLQLPAAALHRLLWPVYGVPLLAFFMTLLALRDAAEAWQLGAALAATLFAALLARRYGERRLYHALRLLPETAETRACLATPQKYSK